MQRNLIRLAVIFTFLSHAAALAAPSSAEVEVLQAQATLQYHSSRHAECLDSLAKILSLDPKNVDALELRALTERRLKNDDAAATTYDRLLKTAPAARLPAYHFELATIRYKQKKPRDARPHFDAAALAGFNAGMSHFFLGIMDFDAKAWRKARNHFTASLTYSDADSMAPVTRYYLANTYAQLGKSDAAVHNYHEAAGGDESRPSGLGEGATAMTSDTRRNALKELKGLDKNQRFINLSMLSQWDSNVQTNPSEVDNAVAASSQKSLKTVISAAAGYSTSPTRAIQITPSYRFFTNYNFHYLARDFNFVSQTPSVYALYKPYSRLSAGLKAEGTFSMKNTLTADDSRSAVKYRPYSLSGDVGPVAKYELTPRVNLGGEVSWRPKKFYQDPATGDSRRTGGGIFSRLSADFVSAYSWWSPLIYFSFEWDHPTGKDYRMYAWGGGISNPLQLSDKLTLTGSLDLVATDYNETINPKRDDVLMSLRILGNYVIDGHWSAMADVGYTDNESSNSTSFKYNRFVFSGGASYSF